MFPQWYLSRLVLLLGVPLTVVGQGDPAALPAHRLFHRKSGGSRRVEVKQLAAEIKSFKYDSSLNEAVTEHLAGIIRSNLQKNNFKTAPTAAFATPHQLIEHTMNGITMNSPVQRQMYRMIADSMEPTQVDLPCLHRILELEVLWQRQHVVVDNFKTVAEVQTMSHESWALHKLGKLKPAASGVLGLRPAWRGDFVRMLERDANLQTTAPHLFQTVQYMRTEMQGKLNQGLGLNLRGSACQLGLFPGNGTRYVAHKDTSEIRGYPAVLTAILYLNPDWLDRDGGALRVHMGGHVADRFQDIMPQGGRLTLFWSQNTTHEVMPTFKHRWALTTWYFNQTFSDELLPQQWKSSQ